LKSIKEKIKTSAKEHQSHHELKQYKPWFDEYLQLLNQRKQTKLQRMNIQEQNRKYKKNKINEPETNSTKKVLQTLVQRRKQMYEGLHPRT
jgi:hypothetical protein